jgi:hypothetical protein
VKEQIKKVSTSLTTYTTSEELFESVRVEIFKAVAAENNK